MNINDLEQIKKKSVMINMSKNLSRLILFIFLIGSSCIMGQEINNKTIYTEKKPQYLKAGLLEFFSGDFSMYYERVISNKISLEAGAGIVFKNFLKEFVEENTSANSKQVIPGPSLSASIRYYPYIPGELFYLSAGYKYRRYRTKYTNISNANQQEETFKEYYGKSIYRLGAGFNFVLDEKMLLDLYSGIGFFGASSKTYFQQINDDTGEYEFISDIQKETKLHFNIGVKISYKL